jgi:hypothetical protein
MKGSHVRTISISTEVFSRLWALRIEGEEDENAILQRVLRSDALPISPAIAKPAAPKPHYYDRGPRTWNQPTWATDIADVLKARGGRARLQQIYDDVEKLRRAAGRSLPKSLEATVRRTLENHSSDSNNYMGGADLFEMPDGKGAGVWALRKQAT